MSRPRRDGSPAQRVTPEMRAEIMRLRRVPVTRIGLTYEEIARQLQLPLATVYRVLQPARPYKRIMV